MALLHIYAARTAFGNFSIAVTASEYSRSDAITIAHGEFGGLAATVGRDFIVKKNLPTAASEVKAAKGWAWVWRSAA